MCAWQHGDDGPTQPMQRKFPVSHSYFYMLCGPLILSKHHHAMETGSSQYRLLFAYKQGENFMV